MTGADSLTVARLFAALFTVFLPGWAAGSIGADPWGFLYALAVFLGGEFFAGLVAILGLATYARRQRA